MAKLDDGDRSVLAESVVFQDLRPVDLAQIEASGLVVQAREGDLLLSEQSRGPGLYLILEGEVEVFLPERKSGHLRRPSAVRLNVLGPGRCLGEYSLIDDGATSAAARTLTPARLFFLSGEEFRRITRWEPAAGQVIYRNLLRFLVARLRAKDRELDLVLLEEEGQTRA